MGDQKRLGFGEFLSDLRLVVTTPSRRFPLILERGAAWGSLVLLLVPAYFGFYFAGGVYFVRDPFPGYSIFPPLLAAGASVFLKLLLIHAVARLFLGKAGAGTGRGTLADLAVVFGYTGVPALLALLLMLTLFLLMPEQLGYMMHNFKVASVSAMIGVGIGLFVWNLILVVLALRNVYPMRDLKIVVSFFLGSAAMIVPALSTFWIVAPARIDFLYEQPILARRILSFITADPTSDPTTDMEIEIHVDRLAYLLRSPERFEMVVYRLKNPKIQANRKRNSLSVGLRSLVAWSDEGLAAGRIVGIPGDDVMLEEGRLIINGQPWDERYLEPEYRSNASVPRQNLGPSQYLVLPEDRRLIAQMPDELVVDRTRIAGRQILSRWPLGWWGLNPTVFLQARPATSTRTP